MYHKKLLCKVCKDLKITYRQQIIISRGRNGGVQTPLLRLLVSDTPGPDHEIVMHSLTSMIKNENNDLYQHR